MQIFFNCYIKTNNGHILAYELRNRGLLTFFKGKNVDSFAHTQVRMINFKENGTN